MKTLDQIIRPFAMARAVRWLQEALATAGVTVPLSNGCLRELVEDADAAARRILSQTGEAARYADVLRAQLTERAQFIQLWTQSDRPIEAERAALVRIARKYALPRAWKVPEPAGAECRTAYFSPWKWASA